ncbi:hypothetical protein WAI453_003905 [Rhynchosporium graminicola]
MYSSNILPRTLAIPNTGHRAFIGQHFHIVFQVTWFGCYARTTTDTYKQPAPASQIPAAPKLERRAPTSFKLQALSFKIIAWHPTRALTSTSSPY